MFWKRKQKDLVEAPQPALPSPLNRWFKNVSNQKELREIIDNPLFLTAVASLKEHYRPHRGSIKVEDGLNSSNLAWYAGFCDAFQELEKLGHPTVNSQMTTTPTQNEEWTHIQK